MGISKFKNETYADFSKSANRTKQEKALSAVRATLGREYPIVVGSERIHTSDKFRSYNPSKKEEVIGVFQKGDVPIARKAVDTAFAAFEGWKTVPYRKRAEYLFKAANVMRKRRFDLNAVMILEVGKS